MAVSAGSRTRISCVTGRNNNLYTNSPYWLRGRELNSRSSAYQTDALTNYATSQKFDALPTVKAGGGILYIHKAHLNHGCETRYSFLFSRFYPYLSMKFNDVGCWFASEPEVFMLKPEALSSKGYELRLLTHFTYHLLLLELTHSPRLKPGDSLYPQSALESWMRNKI